MHYARTATHKYIRSFAVDREAARGADPATLSTFAAGRWIRVDDFDVLTSPTWQAMASRVDCARPPAEELYDLRSDPSERCNLAEVPSARPVLERMRERLREMMEATRSPLLQGHLAAPDKQRLLARSYGPGTRRAAEESAARRELQ
jgi:hypothetical protein